MLYLWPYIAFFSMSLLVGPVLRPFLSFVPKDIETLCNNCLNASSKPILPSLLVSSLFIVVSIGAVHYNTIIHPYTLADNRHYVFYVFRILRQYPFMKYLATAVYCFCAWLVISSLASLSIGGDSTNTKCESRPIKSRSVRQPCQISFIVVWLATTALSLVTAPLVEPRYCIAPWIIWRLHVAYSPASLSRTRSTGIMPYDLRLVFETIWLLTINAAVSYTFLYRPFSWPSEPENKQRFIW